QAGTCCRLFICPAPGHSDDYSGTCKEITVNALVQHFPFNAMRYILTMISTFGDKATALVFSGGFARTLPAHIQSIAHRKLLLIDAAASLSDLFAPPGNRLEALQGERSGQWSIRVND